MVRKSLGREVCSELRKEGMARKKRLGEASKTGRVLESVGGREELRRRRNEWS